MFSTGEDFFNGLFPCGELVVSWIDACWESKIAEKETRGESVQAKQKSSKCRLTLPLPAVWGIALLKNIL